MGEQDRSRCSPVRRSEKQKVPTDLTARFTKRMLQEQERQDRHNQPHNLCLPGRIDSVLLVLAAQQCGLTDAVDRNQEPFLPRESGRGQGIDNRTEMIFQFVGTLGAELRLQGESPGGWLIAEWEWG